MWQNDGETAKRRGFGRSSLILVEFQGVVFIRSILIKEVYTVPRAKMSLLHGTYRAKRAIYHRCKCPSLPTSAVCFFLQPLLSTHQKRSITKGGKGGKGWVLGHAVMANVFIGIPSRGDVILMNQLGETGTSLYWKKEEWNIEAYRFKKKEIRFNYSIN